MNNDSDFKYEVFEEFVYFEFSTEADFDGAKKEADFVKEILLKVKKSKLISKLNYDPLQLELYEDYALAEYYQEIGLDQILSKAALITKKENMENFEFWKTVVQNRFIDVKLFDNYEQAKEWILE